MIHNSICCYRNFAEWTFCPSCSNPSLNAYLVENMTIMASKLNYFIVVFEIFEANRTGNISVEGDISIGDRLHLLYEQKTPLPTLSVFNE